MSYEPFWHTPYTCIYEDNAIRLLQFSDGEENLLILPPQSGQHSFIVDLDDNQSVVQCAIQHSHFAVHAIEWKSCTIFRVNEGIADLINQVDTCINLLGGRSHLIGMSQGGWLSTIYTALHPDNVMSLTVAGAPIDTHQGESALRKIVNLPLSLYYSQVLTGGGMMRGKVVYNAIKALYPTTYLYNRYFKSDRPNDRIFEWRESGQNLSGKWFLWAIENIFKKNKLGKNELYIGDQYVDLTNITCPVHMIVGTDDDIAPPEQTLALQQYVKSPTHCYSVEADHEHLFASEESMQAAWKPLFSRIAA